MPRPTMRRIAGELGVSVMTVSKVLNNHGDISAATRGRVLAKIEELGYQRNAVARSLTLRRSHTIGIVIPDLMHSFFVEIIAGIEPVAVTRRHAGRIGHVHLKSVRPTVAERVRREGWSFSRAVAEGVFTIPGDGCVDFPAVFRILAEADYRGWLVVEAEEDPVKVPALPKARAARDYVRRHAGV